MTAPAVSIVICTDGRSRALAATLGALRRLEGPAVETIIVRGPTEDGVREVLAGYAGVVKIARNPERNLSISRNMGIRLAAGDVVAFLDDDALPEPEWLRDLLVAYEDPMVGAAGGVVMNPDGVTFQARFMTADRLSRSNGDWDRPVPELCFPYTATIPHLMGANCSFRRKALAAVGGFDEEYEYYLDETDLLVRLVDAGWRIAQIDGAVVHHKFLPSALRTDEWVAGKWRPTIKRWYSFFKNRLYFGLRNGQDYFSFNTIIMETKGFMDSFARDMDAAVKDGLLSTDDRARFWDDVDRGWRDGMTRGLSSDRRLADLTAPPPPFLPFPTPEPPGGRETLCLFSQDYPPGSVGGVGRYVHQLARSLAALGHHVHVLTTGRDSDRIDLEDGVWVHRLAPRPAPEAVRRALGVPEAIADRAAALLGAVRQIARKRPVTAIYAPIWDCEGLAALQDGDFALVLGLQTTFRFWLDSHPHKRDDATFMRTFIEPMLAAETRLLTEAHGVHALSQAIAQDIAEAYDVDMSPPRTAVIPLALDDWTELDWTEPPACAPGVLRLLFVGRLEERKGIDVLFQAATSVLARHTDARLDIVGNDALAGPDGRTWRAIFEADPAAAAIRERVVFHGVVDDAALRGFYRTCDILVTPSRFESFGLMLLEGMMFAKPVVGCRVGGMVEVVEDGVSGLLAEPGDAASLKVALDRLIADPALRERLGAAARTRYLARFTPRRLAEESVALFRRAAGERRARGAAAAA